MPFNPDGSLRQFTPGEIAAMGIGTHDVRPQTHPTETREIGTNTMRRTFLVNWNSRYDFCSLVCGDEAMYGPRNSISRMLPDPMYGVHPYFPQIVATKIERVTGFGKCAGVDDYGLPIYPRARVEVFYEHVPYTLLSDADTTSELQRYTWTSGGESNAESITGKGNMMRFRTPTGAFPDGSPIPYSYNVIRGTELFSYHWERVPFLAAAENSNLFNRIYGQWGVFPPFIGMQNIIPVVNRAEGTVLLLGADRKLKRAQSGLGWRWSIEYKFLFAPMGHTFLRYFDLAGGGAGNGWFYAGTGPYRTPSTLNDYESVVQGSRDLNQLWSAL